MIHTLLAGLPILCRDGHDSPLDSGEKAVYVRVGDDAVVDALIGALSGEDLGLAAQPASRNR